MHTGFAFGIIIIIMVIAGLFGACYLAIRLMQGAVRSLGRLLDGDSEVSTMPPYGQAGGFSPDRMKHCPNSKCRYVNQAYARYCSRCGRSLR